MSVCRLLFYIQHFRDSASMDTENHVELKESGSTAWVLLVKASTYWSLGDVFIHIGNRFGVHNEPFSITTSWFMQGLNTLYAFQFVLVLSGH